MEPPDKVKDAHTFFEAVCDAGGAALVAKVKNDFANDPVEPFVAIDAIRIEKPPTRNAANAGAVLHCLN